MKAIQEKAGKQATFWNKLGSKATRWSLRPIHLAINELHLVLI